MTCKSTVIVSQAGRNRPRVRLALNLPPPGPSQCPKIAPKFLHLWHCLSRKTHLKFGMGKAEERVYCLREKALDLEREKQRRAKAEGGGRAEARAEAGGGVSAFVVEKWTAEHEAHFGL